MIYFDVIDRTADGADLEDILKARKHELDMMEELEMVLDTDPAQVNDKGIAQPNPAPDADAVASDGAAAATEDAPATDDAAQSNEDQNNSDTE